MLVPLVGFPFLIGWAFAAIAGVVVVIHVAHGRPRWFASKVARGAMVGALVLAAAGLCTLALLGLPLNALIGVGPCFLLGSAGAGYGAAAMAMVFWSDRGRPEGPPI